MRSLPFRDNRSGPGPACRAILVLLAILSFFAHPPGPGRAGVPPVPLNKEELAFFLGQSRLERGRVDLLRVAAGKDRSFLIQTTLNSGLQHYLEGKLRRAQAPMVSLGYCEGFILRGTRIEDVLPSKK